MKKFLFLIALLSANFGAVNAAGVPSVFNDEAGIYAVQDANEGVYTGHVDKAIMNGKDVSDKTKDEPASFTLTSKGGNSYSLTGNFTIGHPFTMDATVTIDGNTVTLVNGSGTVNVYGANFNYTLTNTGVIGTISGDNLEFEGVAEVLFGLINASFHFQSNSKSPIND